MKGLDKLTSIRLAEALTQKGAVPNEIITEALYAQDRHGESFVENLVESGSITEWDLAKLVVEQFQIPFLMASTYTVDDSVRSALAREQMFENLLVPLDRFGDVLTIAMPILTPFEALMKLRKLTGCDIFPYVGLISENRKVIAEMHPDFFDWEKQRAEERERKRQQRAKRGDAVTPQEQADDWQSIFDSADALVQDTLHRKQ